MHHAWNAKQCLPHIMILRKARQQSDHIDNTYIKIHDARVHVPKYTLLMYITNIRL